MDMQTLYDLICRKYNLDHIVFLDYETFYKTHARGGSKSYSLKNLTYVEYILGDRYQTTGLGIAYGLEPIAYYHEPAEVNRVLADLSARIESGQRIALCAHNAQFDGSIAAWRYGIPFQFYFCTQNMSVLLEPHLSKSLRKVVERLWPDDPTLRKGGVELHSVDGVRYEYFTPEQHLAMEYYCIQDTNLCRRVFFEKFMEILGRGLEVEILNMHMTLRGACIPQFDIERDMLEQVIIDCDAEQEQAVSEAAELMRGHGIEGLTAKVLGSNQQYAELLKTLGITVPLKTSPTTFELTPALGVNDPEYVRVQIDFPDFAPLFKARRIVKSTIAKSRAQRMIEVSDTFKGTDIGCRLQANMPFFLKYYGADQTGRWSGDQKLNQQNNTRGGKHRLSMRAPKGMQIGVCDLSNIELRVNLWFCGQEDILQMFRDDPNFDLYSSIASDIFGRPINKKTDKDERQMGKAAALGLGFSMGWYGFQQYLASGPLGMEPMFKSDAFCRDVKSTYDQKHYAIKGMWHFLANTVIHHIVGGQTDLRFGPNNSFIARKGEVQLPSGRILRYPNARYHSTESAQGMSTRTIFDSTTLDRWGKPYPKNLWHGLLLENIVQATARDILAFQMAQIEQELQANNYGWVMGSVHDESLSALHDDTVEEAFAVIESTMASAPDWCAEIPLANEGGWAREYSK